MVPGIGQGLNRRLPKTLISPTTAARAAMMCPAQRSQMPAVTQPELPVRQKIRSQTKVDIYKEDNCKRDEHRMNGISSNRFRAFGIGHGMFSSPGIKR
jgi:hypothetical protein